MSQEATYKSFTDAYDIPYTVVTILYILSLCLITAIVAVTNISQLKCCKACCDLKASSPIMWVTKKVTKLSSWLIRLVFGKSEGITEEQQQGQQQDEAEAIQGGQDTANIQTQQEAGTTKVYMNDKEMRALDVNILGTIIVCFGLLMGIAAFGVYLLEVTHTCSEDSAIYCFPRFIKPDDPENPNITEGEFTYPITDCGPWVNSSIAPKITFQCFRYAYNGQLALATAGGLLALFTVAMRIGITIIQKIFKEANNCCKTSICLDVTQALVAAFLLLVDVVIAAVVMSFQLNEALGTLESEDDPVSQQTAAYVADNGLQFLVILGTFTLLLLIPWSYYTREATSTSRGGRRNTEKYEMA